MNEIISQLYEQAPLFSVDERKISRDLYLSKLGILVTYTKDQEFLARIEMRRRHEKNVCYQSVRLSMTQKTTIQLMAQTMHNEVSYQELHAYDVTIRQAMCKVMTGRDRATLHLDMVETNKPFKAADGQKLLIPFELVPSFEAQIFKPKGNLVPTTKGDKVIYGAEMLKGDPIGLRVRMGGEDAYQMEIPRKGSFFTRNLKSEFRNVTELARELYTTTHAIDVNDKMTAETLTCRLQHLTTKMRQVSDYRNEVVDYTAIIEEAVYKMKKTRVTISNDEYGV